ncbi:nickel transport protein [Methanobrevibacter arboriphilus JCM 13429 = DSM 1125]|uniref:Nickel transport protein n=1 Tax=Methanobrevibacter arboriphilus JCM 13429 = DSM 1125 TaxID=1300164 RepID=A0A1V6N4L2_METAZ|nr:PDGLE domain-containing protein [Methanobrevibacter arboriphilus]OQD59650.1 nickel transport protein [Methanobrevibacter arboriphilus JCM 13429 = DSM 1125]
MKKKDKYLIIVGIIICIVVAGLSPFIASGDPDGLEKSAEDANVGEDVAYAFVESPFPDYTMGDSVFGEIFALVLGIIITLLLAFGVAYLIKKNKA